MKRILLFFVCFVMLFISLPQNYVYADQQFKRPSFENGGIMSLEMDGFSYYYKDKNAENDDVQPNNTLIRFDYNSGERLYLADNVVYFISDGNIIYYISGVTGDNQIWKMNCDGTNKEHIYSFSSNCITSIQYYKKDGIFGLIDSNGKSFEITVPLERSEQNSNTTANDFVGNNYVGLYGIKETEAMVGDVLYQASIDGELKRTNLNTGEISVLVHRVTKFVTDGQNIYYGTYNESTKKNEIYYIDCNGQNQKLVLSGDGINLQGCWKNKYLYYENIDFTNQDVSFTTWMYDIQTHQKNLLFNQRMGTFKTYRDKLYYIKYTGNDLNKNVGLYSSNFDGSKETLLVNKAYEFNILNNELYYAKYNDDSEYNSDFYMEKSSINGEYPIALCDTIRTTLGVCQKIYEDRVSIVNYDFISEKKYKQSEITVLLDKEKLAFDQPPIIENGRTLVPLRAIFEAMGATVNWNDETKTATGHGKQGYDVIVTENSDTAYIDGFPYKLDVPVKNLNGRLLAPARFVAEAFGGYVNWIADSQTVEIQSLSANVSDNRSYDENARYSTCYEAAMTHGRLVYIADGYKAIVLRNGYIDKVGNQYKFVNSQEISDQRYYFNIINELVTDYELAKRLDFVYNINNNEYEGRSEYWTKKVNVNNEMSEFKETYSLAVDLLKTGATFLNAGYVMYDTGKLVFDQMVVGTIYPPYAGAALKSLPSELAKTTTRMGFDGIILCGLVGSVDEFNGYCNTIAEIYNKYGYGYITSLEDAERFMSAISGQYLLIKQADAIGLYLKTTYPQKTVTKIMGDFANNIVTNFVGIPEFDEILESKKTLKKVYNGVGEVKTYIEGINAEGNVIICKNGTDAFYYAQDMIMRNYTLNETNSKYIELIEKIQ